MKSNINLYTCRLGRISYYASEKKYPEDCSDNLKRKIISAMCNDDLFYFKKDKVSFLQVKSLRVHVNRAYVSLFIEHFQLHVSTESSAVLGSRLHVKGNRVSGISLIRTLCSVRRVSRLERFHCVPLFFLHP